MRGVLELCGDLLLLTRALRATAQSRLNAGALFVPDGLSATYEPPAPHGGTGALPTPEDHDEFEDELVDAMVTPIADPSSAAAVVPLLIRGPADLGDALKLLKFERSFDPALAERADKTLERILQGLDIPKDMVTGLANIRFNNASRIEESFFKGHIEPMTVLIADALTVLWLRPAMLKLGHPPELVDRAGGLVRRLRHRDAPGPLRGRRRRVRPPPHLRLRLAGVLRLLRVRLPGPGGGRLPHPHGEGPDPAGDRRAPAGALRPRRHHPGPAPAAPGAPAAPAAPGAPAPRRPAAGGRRGAGRPPPERPPAVLPSPAAPAPTAAPPPGTPGSAEPVNPDDSPLPA